MGNRVAGDGGDIDCLCGMVFPTFKRTAMNSFLNPACSVCFGDPASLLRKGAMAGVLFLGVVIGVVLFSIAAVAWTWAKRSRSTV